MYFTKISSCKQTIIIVLITCLDYINTETFKSTVDEVYVSKKNVLIVKVTENFFGCKMQEYVLHFKPTVNLTFLSRLDICTKTVSQFQIMTKTFLEAFPDAERYLYNDKWRNEAEHCHLWTKIEKQINFSIVDKCNCFTVEGESGTLSYVNDCYKCT